MLDYAANAVAYWPVEEIRTTFESRCEEDVANAEELAAVLGDDADPGAFWQRVKTNLQAGRVRMVFVADEIPRNSAGSSSSSTAASIRLRYSRSRSSSTSAKG